MQKLIFRNANGVEVDLTSGDFGITEWKGFSDVSLNLQTQQVPFQDGSVYLDGLLGNREISVTLAVNDNNDLEKRYELRRNLIEVLNPKLGEGTLIYKNDYLMRQIKGVPLLPVFKNKNSNDRGTLKASLAWTCPSPYWEDVEEKAVFFKSYEVVDVENNGDIPAQMKIDFFTENVKNPVITRMGDEKKIAYNGILSNNLHIDTNIGNKHVYSEALKFDALKFNGDLTSVCFSKKTGIFVASGAGILKFLYSGENWTDVILTGSEIMNCVKYIEQLNLFVAVGNTGAIYMSTDGIVWNKKESNTTKDLRDVAYSEILNLFVAVGGTEILISSDGESWQSQNVTYILNSIAYSKELNLFVAVGNNDLITSSDGVNWDKRDSGISVTYFYLQSVVWSKKNEQFVAVGYNGKITVSNDGINWVEHSYGNKNLMDVIYNDISELFIAVGKNGLIITSNDGINWTQQYHNNELFLNGIVYSPELNIYLSVGKNNDIIMGENLTDWEFIDVEAPISFLCVIFVKKFKKYFAVADSYIFTSTNGEKWEKIELQNSELLNGIVYSESQNIFVVVGNYGGIFVSHDGDTWLKQTTLQGLLNGVSYSESQNLFVAVGMNEVIFTSEDTISWVERRRGSNFEIKRVKYIEQLDLFVAVGGTPNTIAQRGTILTSNDGINWTEIQISNAKCFFDVTYIPSMKLLVAVGNKGQITSTATGLIVTSNDGVNWSKLTSEINKTLYSVVYSEAQNLLITVGDNGNVFFSKDGKNYERINNVYNSSFRYVCYSDLLMEFLIVGLQSAVMRSVFELAENEIQNISSDSDMNLNIKKGKNQFRLMRDEGEVTGRIIYRQKYIGV